MSLAWFVIQTRAGQERAVSRAVEKLEIEVFYPTFKRSIAVGRRREDVVRPLFPLYLFAAFDAGVDECGRPLSDWGCILRTTGVFTILGVNRRPGWPDTFLGDQPETRTRFDQSPPIPVPDYVITALKQAAILGGGHIPIMDITTEPLPRLVPRQAVRVIEGPFDGFRGLVDQDQKRRVWVLLDIMGKQRRTLVPREALSLEMGGAQ